MLSPGFSRTKLFIHFSYIPHIPLIQYSVLTLPRGQHMMSSLLVYMLLHQNTITIDSNRQLLSLVDNDRYEYINIDSTLFWSVVTDANWLLSMVTGNIRHQSIIIHIRSQSKKKPNIWNSASVSRRRMLATVLLCSGDFKLYFHTSHITPLQLVINLRGLEWTCV